MIPKPTLLSYGILNPITVALFSFYLLVAATRMAIGYWPRYHYPDAGVMSAVPYPSWQVATWLLLALAAIAGPLAAIGWLVATWRRWKKAQSYAMATVIAWVCGAAVLFSDPGAFFNWFFD